MQIAARSHASVSSLSARAGSMRLPRSPVAPRAPAPAATKGSRAFTVLAKKGKGYNQRNGRGGGSSSGGPTLNMPDIDITSTQIGIYVRNPANPMLGWFPLNVVSGGTQVNMVVNAMKTKVGEKVARGALTRNLGGMIYGENMASVQETVKKNYKPLAGAKRLEFGYKILNCESQAAAKKSLMAPDGIEAIPPEDEIASTPVEALGQSVQDAFSGLQDAFKGPK